MKCLARNKRRFFYATYLDKTPRKDDYGNLTGEYDVLRNPPKELFANISAAKGETTTRQFGESEAYDKVIVLEGTAPQIDEYTVLWIDTTPQLDDNGALALNEDGEVITPHDYIVKKVAKSLNSVSIAVSRVKVGG